MPGFSVAAWNVEHFKNDPSRVQRVVDFLDSFSPDVFALFEVEGADVFEVLVQTMPGYTFQITEGPQTQEILIGVKRQITAFITQKVEFRSGTTHMRPGQLVTVRVANTNTSILFLHVASGTNPRGMGLRDDMIERAIDFRKALARQDVSTGGEGDVRYLFVGDLNSMGLEYPFQHNIPSNTELRKWDEAARKGHQLMGASGQSARRNRMRRARKSVELSWSNGSGSTIPDSNLDHVYATESVVLARPVPGNDAEVRVAGWPEVAAGAARDRWIRDHSDHALLYFEVRV